MRMLRHCGRPTGLEDHRVASRVTASERSRAARVGRSRPCDRGAAPVARGDVPEALRGYLLVGRAATAEAVELARIMHASNASSSEFLRQRGGSQAARGRRRHPLWWPSARTGRAKPSGAVARRTKSACGNDGFFGVWGAVEGGRGTFCEIGRKMDRPGALSCAPCALTTSIFARSG